MIFLRLLVVIVLVLSFSPGVASAVSCHCFQDRSYDPKRPTAADAYFLATVQNSLIAASLQVSKKTIVQVKMGGADADLVWVAGYVSDRTGLSLTEILKMYGSSAGSWSSFLEQLLKHADRLDAPFVKALANPVDLEGLAEAAFRSVMVSRYAVVPELLDRLQATGASRQERVMSLFLHLVLAEDPERLLALVRSGGQSWGGLLASSGLVSSQIESSWKKLGGG